MLFLTAVLLAVMPLTEHFWTFDGFLPGGQDFELTLLAILSVSCLVLLLAQSFEEKLTSFIELRESLFRGHAIPSRPRLAFFVVASSLNHPLLSPSPDLLNLPLLI